MPTATPPKQIKPTSLNDYLAVMSKAIFHSGMSWRVVENKWSDILKAFQGFDVDKVANLFPPEIDALAKDTRVIRNRRKIEAIVNNAQKMIDLDREHGSFKKYLQSHGDFGATLAGLKKDFKYMGPTSSYYFLYVVGEEVPPHEVFESTYRK
jgi:3-methyladenine DNA glycosylase Tag